MGAAKTAAAVAILLALSSSAWPSDGVTLIGIVRSALERSPRLEAARLELEAARARIPFRAGRFLPRLSASGRYGRQDSNADRNSIPPRDDETSSYGINLEQPLLSVPDVYEYRRETYAVDAADKTYRAARQDFLAELLQAWLNWHLASDRLRLLMAREDSVRAQRDFAAELAGEDISAQLDVILFEAELDELRASVDQAEAQLESAAITLMQLADLEVQPVSLPGLAADFTPVTPMAEAEWVGAALEANPRLLAAQLQAQEAMMSYRATQALHLPTINLVGQASGDRRVDTTFIGIQAEMPIFSGGQVSAQSQEALLLHEASATRAKQIREEILANISRRHGEAAALVESARSLESAVSRRATYLEKVTLAWKEGFAPPSDVLRAAERLFDSRVQLRTVYYNYLQETATLHLLSGTLEEQHMQSVSEQFTRSRIAKGDL